MKYVFIINPKSGKSELKDNLILELKKYDGKLNYELYFTKREKDATKFVNEYCVNNKDDTVFVSGAVNHKNAIVTCYPSGSGNDFVKVYGGKDKFLNLDNIINGVETRIDVMKVNDMYSVNVTNFGFDAEVCDVANKVRRKKIIGGKRSYTTGIIKAIFTSMKTKCKVVADGEVLADKNILLSTVANGKYVGGAYLCAPYSNNEDGLLEISVIKPISIFKFASLISPYKKGLHLENPKLKNIIKYRQAKKVVIEANEGFKICLDGEIYKGTHFEIENMKQVLRFIRPKE